jgi:hypothetical protein
MDFVALWASFAVAFSAARATADDTFASWDLVFSAPGPMGRVYAWAVKKP